MSEQAPKTKGLGDLALQGGAAGVLAAGLLFVIQQQSAMESTLAVVNDDLTEVVDVVARLHPRQPSVGLAGGGATKEAARKVKLDQLRRVAVEEQRQEQEQVELLEELVEEVLADDDDSGEVEAPTPTPSAMVFEGQSVVVEQPPDLWFDPLLEPQLVPACVSCHEPHPIPYEPLELP